MREYRCVSPTRPQPEDDNLWDPDITIAQESLAAFEGLGASDFRIEAREAGRPNYRLPELAYRPALTPAERHAKSRGER